MKYRISDIKIVDRKRPLGDISQLAESIRDLGLLNPITVKADGTLVAGYHRLSACKFLGWEEIEVSIVELTELYAELAEIDENLIRNELHWTDRDKQITRRKQIYENLHPETKHGNTREKTLLRIKGEVNPNNSDSPPSFSQDTAIKSGLSRDTIEQSVKRATTFTNNQMEVLKRANIPQTDATKLARLEKPKREAVLQKLATAPKPMKVKDAIAIVKMEERVEDAKEIVLPQDMQILRGNFLEIGSRIDDNSVDLIFTDPPYHAEHLELWSELSKFAARVLKPGGILLSYSGQIFLPDVLNRLSEELTYCWMLGIAHTGGHIQIWKHTLWNDWKPIVMFSKGNPVEHDWFMDLYRGDKGDKDAHEWSQGEGEAAYYIEKLTKAGQLVVDPMCGSGTILRAAHKLKRNCIGMEIDEVRHAVALSGMKGLA